MQTTSEIVKVATCSKYSKREREREREAVMCLTHTLLAKEMPESPKLKEEEETSSSPQPEQNAWKVVGSPARRASLNPTIDDGKRVRAASFSAAATPFIPSLGRNAATIPPPGFHETAVDWTPVTPSIWANGSPVVRL